MLKLVCVLILIFGRLSSQCTETPNLSLGTANNSFTVFVNGILSTWNDGSGFSTVINVNGSNSSPLKLGNVTNTTSGVSATLDVTETDCNTIVVQWTVTNGGQNIQTVGACFFGDQNLTNDTQAYSAIPGGYGIFANGHPFYIQSSEAFHGMTAASSSTFSQFCQQSSSNITSNTPTDGINLNWHGVSLNPGEQRVFQLEISNYLSACYVTTSICSDCNASASQCYSKGEYCYYNTSSSTCSNSSGSPTCNSSTCSACLSSFDCTNVGSNCEWESNTCSASSCGSTCSSCSTSISCLGLTGCYFANDTCYNQSENPENPTCSGTACLPCTTSLECTNSSARNCTWNANLSICEFPSASCTSLPRMTWTNSTASYMILLNGTKTTFSSTTGWATNLNISGSTATNLKPNTPVTTNGVTITLTVANENCNSVLVQWTLVNPTADIKNIGICIFADAYILADTDTWTLSADHTMLNVNGPFYIIASQPLTGILGFSSCSYASGFNLSSYDYVTFNWNNQTLPAGETKVFQLRYSNYMIGCAAPSAGCSDCSANATQCYGKSNFCYYNSSTCSNSSGNSTCNSSSCSNCLSYHDCLQVGQGCEWDNSSYVCSGSSCTGPECSTCSTQNGCSSKSGCAYVNSTCLNASDISSCSGTACVPCTTSWECTNTSARNCTWNSNSSFCQFSTVGCTSTPRMTWTNATNSYMILLNGAKTTYTATAGWLTNATVNGTSTGTLKPNTPVTTNGVITNLTVGNEDCNTVLVQWRMVNPTAVSKTIGACVYADAYVIADSDTWTLLPDHTGLYVNGPFYIRTSEPLSGIVSSTGCTSNSFTLGTADTMSFNWNSITLPAGETKIFQARYQNFLSACVAPLGRCAQCNETTNQCYQKSSFCYFNSTSLTCSNTSGNPTCTSSTCSTCLSYYDCMNIGSNCEWNFESHTCGNSSCSGSGCSTCLSETGCIGKSPLCYWNTSSCYNSSENPTCSGANCLSCTTSYECADTSLRSCEWTNNSNCIFNCTGLPRMTAGTGSYSYSYQIYLNGTKTTYSETSGWQSNVTVSGSSVANVKPNIPVTTNNVTTTLTVANVDCNTVLVQWELVNNGPSDRTVGVCVFADAYVLVDVDNWIQFPDHTGLNVNGPFFIIASEPLSGINAYLSCASGYTLTSQDTMSFNWNGVNLPVGETKVFSVRYSNYLSGCANPSTSCGNCSDNADQCFGKNEYCYWNSSSCSNSNGSATCSSSTSCSVCLSFYDCMNVGLNCEWSNLNHICSPSSCSGTTCSSCTTADGCLAKSSTCYYAGGCYNSSEVPSCSASSCYDCLTSLDCSNTSRSCVWSSGVCSLSCNQPPNVTIEESTGGFNVFVNNSRTTYFTNGTGAYVYVNGVSVVAAGLRSGIPVTSAGVTTTMSLLSYDCHTAFANFTVVNNGGSAAIVGLCIHADMNVSSDGELWGGLPDKHGLFTVNAPFYIQSAESFTGVYAGSSYGVQCLSTTSYVNTSASGGISLNWNGISVAAGTTKVFSIQFSNYEATYPTCGGSDLCSVCTGSSSCYTLSSDCYYANGVCQNVTQTPSCIGSACSTCLTAGECQDGEQRSCYWNGVNSTCSSCSSTTCTSCGSPEGCSSLAAQCTWSSAGSVCMNTSSWCSDGSCHSCNSQASCQQLNTTTCTYSNYCYNGGCTSTTPSLVSASGTYSFGVLLNGATTTYSSAGYNALAIINGATSTSLKLGVPQTSGSVRTTLSAEDVNCTTVVVEWEMVNTGTTPATVGACLWADIRFNGTVDNPTFSGLSNNRGIYISNDSWYVQSGQGFTGVFGGSGYSAFCSLTGQNISTGASDGIAVNWHGITLAGGDTRVLQAIIATSELVLGNCTSNTCSSCSDYDSCSEFSNTCYFSGDVCNNATSNPSCTGSSCSCLTANECTSSSRNCLWNATAKTCTSSATCAPWDPCPQCLTSPDCLTAGCLWNDSLGTCFALNCEQYTVQADCPTTGISVCGTGASNYCSWNNSVCIDNGCSHNTDCLYGQSFCTEQSNCAWNAVLSVCYYNGPSSSSNCFSTNTSCSACNSSRLCHGKNSQCYWNASSSSCSNSTVSATCSTTSACGSCIAQVECEANLNECNWNITTMTCSAFLCGDSEAPCSACNASASECHAKDSHCYYTSGLCRNSSIISTCESNSVCSNCSSAFECTTSSVNFGCTWNSTNFACISPSCTSREPYFLDNMCWVNPQEQCYRNGTTCVADCGNFVNQTTLTTNGSCSYVQTDCFSRIAENISGTNIKTCGGDLICYYFPDYSSYHLSSPYVQCNTSCPTNYQTTSELINGFERYYCAPQTCLNRTPPDCLLPGESDATCILNNGMCRTECPEFTMFQDGNCVPISCSSRTANTTTLSCGADSCYYFSDGTGNTSCETECPINYNNLTENVNDINRYFCTAKNCDERVPSPNCILPGDVQTCYIYGSENKCYSTCPAPITAPSSQSCVNVVCASRSPIIVDGQQYCGNDSCYYLPDATTHQMTACIASCPGNYIPESQQIFTGSQYTTRYHCAAPGSCEARAPINNNCSLPNDGSAYCLNYNGSCYDICPPHTVGGTVGGILTCTLVPCSARQTVADVHCRVGLTDACFLKGTQCTEQCGAYIDATASVNTGICTYFPTCTSRQPQGATGSETCGGSSVENVDPPCYYFSGSGSPPCGPSCPQSYSAEYDGALERYYCAPPCAARSPTNNNCSVPSDGISYCYSYEGQCVNSCPVHSTSSFYQPYTCSVTPCENRVPSEDSTGPCRTGVTDNCYEKTFNGPATCVSTCGLAWEPNEGGVCMVVESVTVVPGETIAGALERAGFDKTDHGLIEVFVLQTEFIVSSTEVSNLNIVFTGSSSNTNISNIAGEYDSIFYNTKISSVSNTVLRIPGSLTGVIAQYIIHTIGTYGSSYTATNLTVQNSASSIDYTVILVEGMSDLTLNNFKLNGIKYQFTSKPIIYSNSSGSFIINNSIISDSASSESVIVVNQSSTVNVNISNTKISSASTSSPSISINLLGTGSSTVTLSNVNITTSASWTRQNLKNAALQCSWTTGVVILTNVTASIGQSIFSGLNEGALKVVGGSITINGSTFTNAVQTGTGYSSGSKIGTCSSSGSIGIINSYFGGTASTASGSTSLWISTPPTNTCSITVNGATQNKPIFIPTLTSAQVDETSKTITLSGTNLYSCIEEGVVEYVVYEVVIGGQPTYEVLTPDADKNTDSTFVSSYNMNLGVGGNEKRVGIRYFGNSNVTDSIIINTTSAPDDNSPSAQKKKNNTGVIVGVVVAVVVVVIVVVIIAVVIVVLQKRKIDKKGPSKAWISGSSGKKSGPSHHPLREARVKAPTKGREPVRAEPVAKLNTGEEEVEVEEDVEEEVDGEGEEDVEEEVEEGIEEEMEVDDDNSSEDYQSTSNLI